jgi:hypothetical protein
MPDDDLYIDRNVFFFPWERSLSFIVVSAVLLIGSFCVAVPGFDVDSYMYYDDYNDLTLIWIRIKIFQ